MIEFDCPNCHKFLRVKDELRGRTGKCPRCRQAIEVPMQSQVPSAQLPELEEQPSAGPPSTPPAPAYQAGVAGPKPPAIISIPLLVSAICNCLAAVFWICTCYGVVIAAPLVVLLVFEFMLYAELDNRNKIVSPSKVKTIAICEIVAGLFSLAPLVCGIIILANLGGVDINSGKSPGSGVQPFPEVMNQ